MKTVEERLKSYEPLWENWTYTGEFLGEGAMSSVFEIQSTAMGIRQVAALKIITVKKSAAGTVEIPENAMNEIKLLKTLSGCSNIVSYHDSTQRKIYDDNGEIVGIDILIRMEKLRPLSETAKLTEKEISKLGKDMCNALVHAAEHRIIHRDIKPQNIFVDEDGNYKLGDFGIAKIVSGFSSHYTMNIGTLAYTAPEVQSNTTGKYDISSDIYSLGLVLYLFANNGYLPFESSGSSLHDSIMKRLSGSPFPSPANGSKNLKSIIMRACNSDLTKRYRRPEEMIEDLELLSTGGKKMVVDPFATLDANIDITEEMTFSSSRDVLKDDFSSGFSGGASGGFSSAKSSSDSFGSSSSSGKAKLVVKMNTTSDSTPKKSDEDLSAFFAKEDSGKFTESDYKKSKLKINMKSSVSGGSSGSSFEEKPEEKKKDSSFFDTPTSI